MTILDVRQKVYTVSWNGQPKPLLVPRDNLAYELTMTDLPPLPDVAGAIIAALEAPLAGASPPPVHGGGAGRRLSL